MQPEFSLRDGPVRLGSEPITLTGDLRVPDAARSLVVFAHGHGGTGRGRRDEILAEALSSRGIATLRFDMLTAREEQLDSSTAGARFDHGLLAGRLLDAIDWVRSSRDARDWKIGLMGSSIGAAAALIAAARRPDLVAAVVSRGGRTDLATQLLGHVSSPTLLVVGAGDAVTLEHNRLAHDQIAAAVKRLAVVPDAGHAFDEPGALEGVAALAGDWFVEHLAQRAAGGSPASPFSSR